MMSTKTLVSIVVIFLPSLGFGAPKEGVTEQEVIYVRASPLKASETAVETSGEIDESGGEGLGYGSGVGTGSGGYGEGTSDYYGESNYGYTSSQPTSGNSELVVESAAYEIPTEDVSAPIVVERETVVMESAGEERSWSPYVSIMGGLVDPYRLSNANGKGAVGVGAGVLFGNNIAVEASFLYAYLQSSHGYCQTTDASCGSGGPVALQADNFIDHYSGAVEAKYFFDIGSLVMPNVGVLGAYTFRRHTPNASPAVRDSRAFDAGVSMGLDFRVSENVQLGTAWRYMTNLAYDINGGNSSEAFGLREVPSEPGGSLSSYETSDYQVWMANVKILF